MDKAQAQAHQHRLLMAPERLRLSRKEKYTKVGIVATPSSPWYKRIYRLNNTSILYGVCN
mgnify:CR=1 FL=1